MSSTGVIMNSKLSRIALLILSGITFSAQAGINDEIESALKFNQADSKYGQIKFDLRFRYEQADSDNPKLQVGNAATIRLDIGYLTPEFYGFQAYVEYEGNQDIVANDYNSTRNGKTGYEIVADPQEHELNQLWLSYKGIPNTEIKVGRQKLNFDNQRFIGSVDWRQMSQTYDAVVVTNTSLPNTKILVGYSNKVETVSSYMKDMQFPFANLTYSLPEIGALTGYAYLMDFNAATGAIGGFTHNESNQTYGIRLDGGRKLSDDIKLLYTAEYAYQSDYTQNPTPYHADYYHFIGGVNLSGIILKGGMEQLDGKGVNKTFDTPLATLHIFNGWADQFLVTPAAGLRDVYGLINTDIEGIKLTAAYHDYTDDSGKLNYGNEWNFMATKEFFKHYNLLAKYAYFDARGASGKLDTQKFWLGVGVSF
ncbi:MAG: hypothetical protein RL637_1548 [Pseudomonadota bacterium]|jgi:hypothetical protein